MRMIDRDWVSSPSSNPQQPTDCEQLDIIHLHLSVRWRFWWSLVSASKVIRFLEELAWPPLVLLICGEQLTMRVIAPSNDGRYGSSVCHAAKLTWFRPTMQIYIKHWIFEFHIYFSNFTFVEYLLWLEWKEASTNKKIYQIVTRENSKILRPMTRSRSVINISHFYMICFYL